MRDRRDVADGENLETDGLQGPQRGLAARTRPLYMAIKGLHAMVLRLAPGIFGRDLRSVRGRFAAALEPHASGGRPGDRIALCLCYRAFLVAIATAACGE